jgi:predicted N-formylglutamate amidohydrolase
VLENNKSHALLGPDDPPAFTRHGRPGELPALLCCDHASRAIPRSLAHLGLSETSLTRHIAWDIGAAELARELANRLDVEAILAGFSRLVIDCNRQLDDPTSIAALSDGESIPGNAALTPEQRGERVRSCFRPYQEAVAGALEALRARGLDRSGSARPASDFAPALIAVHSFTPLMQGGTPRPWHCGVLWNVDPRIAVPLIQALRLEPGLIVGDNEPYSGRHPAGYTIDIHAEQRGWPGASLEIRQDLIADRAGVLLWADILSRALRPILSDATLYRAESTYRTNV